MTNFGFIFCFDIDSTFLLDFRWSPNPRTIFWRRKSLNQNLQVSLVSFEYSLCVTYYPLILEIPYDCNSDLKLLSTICDLIFFGDYLKLFLKLFSNQFGYGQAFNFVWLLGYLFHFGIVWFCNIAYLGFSVGFNSNLFIYNWLFFWFRRCLINLKKLFWFRLRRLLSSLNIKIPWRNPLQLVCFLG